MLYDIKGALSNIGILKQYLSQQNNTSATFYTILCNSEDLFKKFIINCSAEKIISIKIMIIIIINSYNKGWCQCEFFQLSCMPKKNNSFITSMVKIWNLINLIIMLFLTN